MNSSEPDFQRREGRGSIPISLHMATLILAFSPVFAFLIKLGPLEITAGRTVFGAIGLSGFTFLLQKHKISMAKLLRLSFFPGALLAAHWTTYFFAIQKSGVAAGVLSAFTFPAITFLLEPFFYKKRPDLKLVLNALWTLSGIAFLFEWGEGWSPSYTGILVGLLSALLYSLRNIWTRKHVAHTDPLVLMSGQLTIAAILLLPAFPIETPFRDPLSFLYLVLLGIAITGVGHTLWTRSLSGLSASRVSLFSSITPLYSIVYSYVYPGEPFRWKILVAALVIVSGIYFEAKRKEDI